MIGEYKSFSKSLHSKNDPQSRTVVIRFFKKKGIPLLENPDKYGVDLISPDGTLQIEIEHRLSWDAPEFPFPDINIPERKAKFFGDDKTQYVILSKDYEYMGVLRGKDMQEYIHNANLHENKNKFVKNGELFFKVPVNKFKWVKV